MTQMQKVLHHLANAKHGLTRQDAMMNLGVANLTARISDIDTAIHWDRVFTSGSLGSIPREMKRHPVTGQKYTRYYLPESMRQHLVDAGFLRRAEDGSFVPTAKVAP